MAENQDLRLTSLSTFENLFDKYYSMLCLVAYDFLKNKALAEEIVDEVFMAVWQKRDVIQINQSIRAYLVKSVKNRCINWFEQTKTERIVMTNVADISVYESILWDDDYPLGKLLEQELRNSINESINALPEQCKRIYQLSRNEDLSYEEIAARLNISVNTVKTQMKIALAKLREALRDYLPLLFFWFLNSR